MKFAEVLARATMKKDGSDHILVSPFGGTKLGKVVSLGWRKAFFVPQMGEFASPYAFVAWLFLGDEDQRHNHQAKIPQIEFKTKEEAIEFKKVMRAALLVAKFHQLCSLAGVLHDADKQGLFEMSWVEYRQHTSGVKEMIHDRWDALGVIKKMAQSIIINGTRANVEVDGFDLNIARSVIMGIVKDKFVNTDETAPDTNIQTTAEIMEPAAAVKQPEEETVPT